MGFSTLGFFVFLQLGAAILAQDVRFDDNYMVQWGFDHFEILNEGREVQLSMDNNSGAGFESKLNYGSGFFHMRIKLPDSKDTAGVVTTFYLTSGGNTQDELDFEFLGNIEGQPITLQTNVFTHGQGGREQRITLWFDPAADYHDYKILWNHHQIVFYVDDTPIRVFRNNQSFKVAYLVQPMKVQASLWQADWATYGHKTNWSYAPFKAHYQGFDISGCTPQSSIKDCYAIKSNNYWWNHKKYWELDSNERQAYESVRRNYLHYDYCTDHDSNLKGPPPRECELNS